MANSNNVDLTQPGLFVLMTGVCHCVVCAPSDWSADQVIFEANQRSPTGISSAWSPADPAPTETGEGFHNVNQLPCPDEPGRLHWLLSC